MLLRKTQNAVAELAASQPYDAGSHMAPRPKANEYGLSVGETEFDFGLHDVSHAKLFSMSGEFSGTPQIPVVVPEKALDVSIIVHNDPRQANDPEDIYRGRRYLASAVGRLLSESLLYGDTSRLYVVGQADEALLKGGRGKFVADTEAPHAAAKSVADLSKKGLTVVVSTFNNLPLDQTGHKFTSTVGVKANHIYDRKLEQNIGKWDTGELDMPVVNTQDQRLNGKASKDLVKYWDMQADRHEAIIRRMHAAGLKMASVVFDKHITPKYFDGQRFDKDLARAIKLTKTR